jgi:SET domain-containing protein
MRLKKNAKIFVQQTPLKGRGLFAAEEIPANTFVREYVGEIIGQDTLSQRRQTHVSNKHMFVAYLNKNRIFDTSTQKYVSVDTYLDSTHKASISRFINHSCDPNCRFETWNVDNHMKIGIFTTRCLSASEELTFDYMWDYSADRIPTKCLCGSEKCRGYLEILSQVCDLYSVL